MNIKNNSKNSIFLLKKHICQINTIMTAAILLSVIVLTFWIETFRYIDLPGLFMDGINPEYLAAHILNPTLNNPIWLLPTKWPPLLGNLYHGMQTLYVGLTIYWLFGMNIVAARISQSLFGMVIAIFVFTMVLRTSKSRLLAFGITMSLITDIAFIASFRTQFYLILSGAVWLLLAIMLLTNKDSNPLTKKNIFASGLCFGLAIYGYFVFGFFSLAFLFQLALTLPKNHKLSGFMIWGLGFLTGLTPYALGYFSMYLAFGDIREMLTFLKNAVTNLAPLSSKLSIFESYQYCLNLIKLAITNAGNELMIFGKTSNYWWAIDKYILFMTVLIFSILSLIYKLKSPKKPSASFGFPIATLPISYLICSGLFGERLWAHHFSVMPVLFYLMCAQVFHEMRSFIFLQKKYNKLIVIFILIAFIFANILQQNIFFKELDKTGGIGKFSNSINILASEALSEAKPVHYLFPEWGFFMPFAFLTGNKVPYCLDLSPSTVNEIRNKREFLSLFFWDKKDIKNYQDQLMLLGVKDISLRVYTQRDTAPAFYSLTGSF